MSNEKKKKLIVRTMTEDHCNELAERGILEKIGEHEFRTAKKNRYGIATIRFRPDLPGLPVKHDE